MRALIISGLSGSGKTTVKSALEDLGYYCIDNLPLQLLEGFLFLSLQSDQVVKVAIIMDLREKGFARKFPKVFQQLTQQSLKLDLLFLEAKDEVLKRRYSETRRVHPLAGSSGVSAGIKRERKLLSAVKDLASQVIDTSQFNVHQLKKFIIDNFAGNFLSNRLQVNFLSFGYRYGLPANLNLLFDVRFLPNPYFKKELKKLSGLNKRVKDYILRKKEAKDFINRASQLIGWLLPQYEKEGKAYCTIGIGCTGGRHRSVALAETLAKKLNLKKNAWCIEHRDIDKEGKSK